MIDIQIKSLKQIDSLLEQFDIFLIDAWGVLHDGHTLYPGAKATLELLNEAHKHCLIVSNAIRRHDEFKAQLKTLGLGSDLYSDIVTSGELCWQAFKQANDVEMATFGISGARRCFQLSSVSGDCYARGLDLEMVDKIEEAQFILNTLAGGGYKVSDYTRLLDKANNLGIPMVCPNPDLMAIMGGLPIITAGSVAKAYEAIGGRVKYFGKPYAPVYEHCFSLFEDSPRSSFVAIGDGLPTDIKGANQAGIDSILVASGIHQEELAIDSQETVFAHYGARPTYLLNSLRRD